MKEWKSSDYYNFDIEFNRLSKYTIYCNEWLYSYFNYKGKSEPIVLDETVINSNRDYWHIVDLAEYNSFKLEINKLIRDFKEEENSPKELDVYVNSNQNWTSDKANELERAIQYMVDFVGYKQFTNNVCGLSICGNNNRIGGVK